MLLGVGLTQVPPLLAILVVGWFFALAYRGRHEGRSLAWWLFDLRQAALVLATLLMLGILVYVVHQGLLGAPSMWIEGNGSSDSSLSWYQPASTSHLPSPVTVSISIWYYRVLMLGWSLWLAHSLLRWLRWAWQQWSSGAAWKTRSALAP